MERELSDQDLDVLDEFLNRVVGGQIGNSETLDGFLAALACSPITAQPSEFMAVIQSGRSDEDDLVFETTEEAEGFMSLVLRHWNHVNRVLSRDDVYLPMIYEDSGVNDWAKGFLKVTQMHWDAWHRVMDDEENGGPFIPIFALAYEDSEDKSLRPYKEPIDTELRENLIVHAAAGVIKFYRYFKERRNSYGQASSTFVRAGRKIGRNELCSCGSGKKFKKCCGLGPTIH